jgi:hypothetical protein
MMLRFLMKCSELQSCVNKLWEATLLSISQGASYYAQGCAVVNVFMDIITTGCYGVLIFMQYVLGISRQILLPLICMCVPSVWAMCRSLIQLQTVV